uniref:Uncharacterized protein n=1 Tax=Amphimedon queenslandica TaxID=400682 RepID=A0A1X7U8K8_AMPQE
MLVVFWAFYDSSVVFLIIWTILLVTVIPFSFKLMSYTNLSFVIRWFGTLPPPTSYAHAPTFQGQPLAVVGSFLGLTPQPLACAGSEISPAIPRLVVPQMVSERILKGRFVDMAELHPDSWRYKELQHPGSSMCSPPWRPPITDIAIWVECYTLMAGVICSRYPEKATQLFQYLRTIVRVSRNFEESSWVSYDSAFRRLAANSCSFDW